MKKTMSLMITVLMTAQVSASDLVERAGDVLAVALPLTALTATYTLEDREGRTQAVLAYGTTLGLTYAGKFAVGKERPDGSDRLSFPSAHTSSAFAGASFLARRYGWDVGVPAYLAATFVGGSRIYAERHDGWDVAAGAILAIGVNHWLADPLDTVSATIQPMDGGVQWALAWRY